MSRWNVNCIFVVVSIVDRWQAFPGADKASLENRACSSSRTNSFLADMLQGMLEDLGCEVVGPVGSGSEAIHASQSVEIDAAITDLILRGERVAAVADRLSARGVPFGFATGPLADGVIGSWKDHPFLLSKLYSKEQVGPVLFSLLPARS